MNLVQRASEWLRNNHIIVNEDWLRACVEWIQEENRERALSDDDINSQVYEQWLLADLHELETSSLPSEVPTAQKYELKGAYTLQIDSIVDVGVSFYSQQQKLKGTENANVHVNAEEPVQKPWEAKPSRMLMFKVTDGTHNVQGMEYRPISCLSPQTIPGSKILVYGTVLCRHGILMLNESNIKFLGGEVDTLVEANTMANVLQSAMEGSEEHAGKEHKQVFSGSEIRHNKEPVTIVNIKAGTQHSSWVSATNNAQIRSQQSKPQMQTYGTVKKEPVTQNRTVGYNYEQNQGLTNYDALLDDDMDVLMEEMNTDFPTCPSSITGNGNRSSGISDRKQNTCVASYSVKTKNNQHAEPPKRNLKGLNTGSRSLNSRSSVSAGAGQSVLDDDLIAMEFEEDMDFPPMDDNEDFQNSSSGNCSAKSIQAQDSAADFSNSANFAKVRFDKECGFQREKTNIRPNIQQSVQGETVSVSDSNCTLNLMNGSKVVVFNDVNMTGDISSHRVGMSDTSSASKSERMVGDSSLNLVETDASISNTGTSLNTKTGSKSITVSSKVVNVKSEASKTSSSKQGRIDTFFSKHEELVVKEEVEEAMQTLQVPDIQSEYPFTYLRKVMSLPVQDQPTYHTVKAYISTLTSKLTSTDGKWSLTCKINDGTMAVDVDLSNQVLTNMIGFSHQEAQLMKQRVRTDPKVKEVLQEGIQQCQQKLIELMCLLELEICARNPRPVIVATKQLTSNHIDMLYNRVMNSLNT